MPPSLSNSVVALVATGVFGAYIGLSGCKAAAPTSPEQCAAMSEAPARDECYLVVAPGVFVTDAKAGITLVETGITDPLTRDMAWYTVTKTVDPYSNKYCDRIQDATVAQRCRTVVSRPHLHRELTGKGGAPAGGGPGGPSGGGPSVGGPPGAGAPGGGTPKP
jgi:hypothetical protein